MPDIEALSPIADHAFAPLHHATLTEVHLGSLCQVAGWPGGSDALATALDAASLPPMPAPCGSKTKDGVAALDIGPNTALLSSDTPDLFDRLSRIPPETGVVTDLSHARVALDLEGPRARWILSKGIAIDLHDTAFPIGACAQTTFDGIGVTLHRRAEDEWRLLAYRGFARDLVERLETAGGMDTPG
ncbi:sarcosine oxidase subunit gamma [Jannaschia donghaensis]|uniref:Sarcosine oxidase, gamma subunit family n=1 Tax=Jannaschia donghaensis TaxID=420998 RepID=A0A0M6YLV1_9RHOB|nr:sarcosine oxidase subunit gamma family protein [Jannaschia donghaensis]CTQ50493.1 sarcosine oxidase, gamma subunit family [Jannaschia donghaensis]